MPNSFIEKERLAGRNAILEKWGFPLEELAGTAVVDAVDDYPMHDFQGEDELRRRQGLPRQFRGQNRNYGRENRRRRQRRRRVPLANEDANARVWEGNRRGNANVREQPHNGWEEDDEIEVLYQRGPNLPAWGANTDQWQE